MDVITDLNMNKNDVDHLGTFPRDSGALIQSSERFAEF